MSGITKLATAILEPANGAIYVATDNKGDVAVTLRGKVDNQPGGQLYHTWYSSLHTNEAPLAEEQKATVRLCVGSHTLTYVVSDQKNPKDLEKAQYIGASGGSPASPFEKDKPCVIHVLVANIITPEIITPEERAMVSRTSALLEAEAPLQWGRYVEPEPKDKPPGERRPATEYPEPNPDYHEVNKVRYRWSFQQAGAAEIPLEVSDRDGMVLIPPHKALEKPDVPKMEPPPRLRYQGALPIEYSADAEKNEYELILRVSHSDHPEKVHEMRRNITIEP